MSTATPPSTARGALAGRRIALVNWRDLGHPNAGGSEHYAWQLARGLVEAGAEVEFLTARAPGQARRETVEGIVVDRAGGTFGFYLTAAARLLRRRRRLDAVVDPACGIPTFAPLFVRRRTPVLLVVHHVHQDQFGTYFPAPVAAFGRFLERRLMPRVYRRARTVAVSESTRHEMRRRLHWRGPVGLLANGTDLPSEPVTLAEKDPARLVVLGRLVEHKRVEDVLEAFAVVAEAADLHLDVVGTGPRAGSVRASVDALGLQQRVTLHGFVDDERKAALLRRAALHVCASDAEGWGQVVIEAAAYGTPTLARDVPGLRDSVLDGLTGRLLPEPDPAIDADADADADAGAGPDLAARLAVGLLDSLAALAEPGAREAALQACRTHAAGFSWQAMRDHSVAILAALLPSEAAPAPVQPAIRTQRPAPAGVLTER